MVYESCYHSKILLTFPDYSVDPSMSILAPTDNFSGLAGSWRTSFAPSASIKIKSKYSFVTAEDIEQFNFLFDRCYGRLRDLWVPSWQKDLVLTKDIVAGDGVIYIEDIDYDIYYPSYPGTGRVLFFYASKLKYEIKTVYSVTNKTELNLYESFVNSFTRKELKYVSFLYLMRFDQDDIEWEYIAPREVAQLEVEFVELPSQYCSMLPTPVALSTPHLIGPTGAIALTKPNYQWYVVPNATRYCLWIKDSTGVVVNHWYRPEKLLSDWADRCDISNVHSVAPGEVTWRVQADNPLLGPSSWSAEMTFTVTPVLPATVTLIAPSVRSSEAFPEFIWSGDPLATQYYLWVQDSVGVRIQIWYTLAELGIDSEGNCHVTPTNVLVPGWCKWYVQAWNESGYSDWSEGMQFLLEYPPPAITVLTSPSDLVTDSTPTYVWEESPLATAYYLMVESASGRVINEWYTVAEVDPGGTGTCSITPLTALEKGNYKWWVQSYNPEGYGPWSEPLEFSVSI
jgi:hypothetical protein